MSSTISILNKNTKPNSGVNNISQLIGILFELTKFRITFFVAVTTLVGFIIQNGGFSLSLLLPTLGVLILACGASALNEWQERNIDSMMIRTSNRPLPSNRISPSFAISFSLILILLGSIILALNSVTTMLLGVFTLVWYNGVYTPLKQKSAIAIIPGSIVGALPPVIGWVAAGGTLLDPKILSLALFMFIWQIPHFWLLLLMYDDQYRSAGFPTLSQIFSFSQITKITFSWIVVLVLTSAIFFFSDLSGSIWSNLLLVVSGLVTIIMSFSIIKSNKRELFKKKFLLINTYVLLVLIVISIENII